MSGDGASATEKQFYKNMRKTIRIWAGGPKSKTNRYTEYILAAPDLFMLMANLSRDERVSRLNRAKMAGAVAYFINPLDFVPEIILGPAGLVDDVALAAYVLYETLETSDPKVIQEHWQGDADILDLTRQILNVADKMVGGPIWRRIIARVDGLVSSG